MMSTFAINEQAQHLQSLFSKAEIEINGTIKPVALTSLLDGNKVRFSIDVPASEVGTITRRIIKSASNQVCWSDPPGTFNIVKDNTDLTTEIPIEITWKEPT